MRSASGGRARCAPGPALSLQARKLQRREGNYPITRTDPSRACAKAALLRRVLRRPVVQCRDSGRRTSHRRPRHGQGARRADLCRRRRHCVRGHLENRGRYGTKPGRNGRRGSSARHATFTPATTDFQRKRGTSDSTAASRTRPGPGGSRRTLVQVAAAEASTPTARSLGDAPISTTHNARNPAPRYSTTRAEAPDADPGVSPLLLSPASICTGATGCYRASLSAMPMPIVFCFQL